MARPEDLPPDYVSLAQLKEIWLKKKEEEKKLKEKEEEEEKRKMGLSDGKGKGKEIIIGGYENVEGNKKKANGRYFRKPESAGNERIIKEVEKEKIWVETGANNGIRGGIPDGKRTGFKGRNGGSYGRGRYESGERVYELKKNEGASDFGGGMLDDKGYNRKEGERGRNNGGYLNRDYRLKESSDAVLIRNGDTPETVKKEEYEIRAVFSERRNNGGYINRYSRLKESRGVVSKVNGVETEMVKKGEEEIVEVFGERGRNNCGFLNGDNRLKESRDVVSKNNQVEPETVNKAEDEIAEVFSERGRNINGGFLNRDNRLKESRDVGSKNNRVKPEMVKKGEDDIAEVFVERGRNINGGFLNRDNRLKESRDDVVKKGDDETVEVFGEGSGSTVSGGNGYKGRNKAKKGRGNSKYKDRKESRDAVLKFETEKKAKDEIVEVFNEKCRLSEGDRNGDKKRNETNENRVEGEDLSDYRVALKSKVDDGVLKVLSVENSEKERGGKRFKTQRYEKSKKKGNRFKESRVVVIDNEVEVETEKKGKDESLEVFNEKYRNDDEKRNKTNENRAEGEDLSDYRVALKSKVDDGVLKVLSVENGKKEREGKRFKTQRYEKSKKRDNRFNNEVEVETEKKGKDESLEVFNEKYRNDDEKRNKTNVNRVEGEGSSGDRVALKGKVGDGVLTVGSVKNDKNEGVGKGHRRQFGERKYNRSKKSRDAVLMGDELVLETEKNAKDDNSEVFHEKNDDGKRNETTGDKVEGEGSSDDKVALESKVDDGVLMVESVKNGEKERVGKEHRRHFGKRNSGHNRLGNWMGYFGEKRHARFEISKIQPKMERGGAMMWVKKEEKSGDDAAGSSAKWCSAHRE